MSDRSYSPTSFQDRMRLMDEILSYVRGAAAWRPALPGATAGETVGMPPKLARARRSGSHRGAHGYGN